MGEICLIEKRAIDHGQGFEIGQVHFPEILDIVKVEVSVEVWGEGLLLFHPVGQ